MTNLEKYVQKFLMRPEMKLKKPFSNLDCYGLMWKFKWVESQRQSYKRNSDSKKTKLVLNSLMERYLNLVCNNMVV